MNPSDPTSTDPSEDLGAPDPALEDPTDGSSDTVEQLKEKLEKWKTLSQKHEKAWKAKSGDLSLDAIEQLKAKAAKLDAIEEGQKSEAQKLLERAELAERELQATKAAAAIDKAARRHGVPDALVKFISGSTEDEIDAAAKELADEITAAGNRGDGLPGKPKPSLTPGGGSADGDAVDVNAVIAAIKNKRY